MLNIGLLYSRSAKVGARDAESDADFPEGQNWKGCSGQLRQGFARTLLKRCASTALLVWGWGVLDRRLERKMGIEPTTFSLARRRSTTEPLPLASLWVPTSTALR